MDIPKRHGGQPYIMADGYVIPLQLENGLMKINIRLPTEHELHTCIEIELTSDLPWNPHELTDSETTIDEYNELCEAIPNLEDIRNMNLMWSRDRPKEVNKAEPYLLYPGE